MTHDEKAAGILDGLAAAIAEAPPPTYGWSEDEHDLYERSESEPGLPLTDEQRQRFASARSRQRAVHRIEDLLRLLTEAVRQERVPAPAVSEAAEACVRAGLAVLSAIDLLAAVGVPHGEQALARVVLDESVGEHERCWAREHLLRLRRPRYEELAARPVEGEEPLLPEVVRGFPYGRHGGVAGPDDPEPTEELLFRARAVLEALLPDRPLVWPEPLPEPEGRWYEGEEERPAWVEVSIVLGALMPDARRVTRERMTEGWRECTRLGIELQDSGLEDFIDRWVTRIGAWIAEWTLSWLALHLWREGHFPAWSTDLATLYAQRRVAVEQASVLLSEAADVRCDVSARHRA
ncbi:hypothetical protein ACIF8T_38325 [Streptomyces sp. NPDC085946]|uniref:hypothetical protein n=1 Tax=Streptomyces sp. NPDC085946 TaxID=3365744 RepID=UPI0037CF1CF7